MQQKWEWEFYFKLLPYISNDLIYYDDDVVLQVHRLRESNDTCISPSVML